MQGDTSVGKSCLVVRFVRGEYFDYQEPTIGAAFLTQTVVLDDCVVRFELWDTAGQERYRSLAPMYYRGAAGAVVVFDVTNRDSFEGAKGWVKELMKKGDPNVVIALAGNKADIKEGRAVSAEEARDYAKENGIIYFDTSAKSGLNVKEMFAAIGTSRHFFGCPRVWLCNKVWGLLVRACVCAMVVLGAARKLPKNLKAPDHEILPDLNEPPKRAASGPSCCGGGGSAAGR